ncbi:MAG: AEC family transporter [Nitratireductor sp.]
MAQIFLTILPVFLVLGTGYLGARTGYLNTGIADALNNFAVKLAVPTLLMRAMYNLDFSQAFYPPMLGAFYCGALASFVIAIIAARTFWNRRPGEAVAIGFCAMFSNTVLFGLPIMERAFGAQALPPAFGIISLHAPCLYAVGMITMELSRTDGRPLGVALKAAARSILTNPFMIGVLLGTFLNLASIPIPEPLMAAINMLATAAIPAALVGIGAALTRYSLRSEFSESVMVSALSLVVHPAIAFVLSWHVLGLPIEYVRAAVVIAAMPPGMNGYIFAAMYDRAMGVAASSLIVANLLSVFTITAWLALLAHLA